MTESEMPTAVAWSTSPAICSPVRSARGRDAGGTASLWAVIVAALVINSRHVMYSAALAPTFQEQPRWFRWVGSFVLIDQIFALVIMPADRPPESSAATT
jgi:hypothetical protein